MESVIGKLQRSKSPVRIDIGVSWQEIERTKEMANEDYVLVNDLAKKHGYNRSGFRKRLIRNGYVLKKLRTVSSGGQWNLVITKEEAKKFLAQIENEYLPGR